MCSRKIIPMIACVAVSAIWLTPGAVAAPVKLSVHAWSDSGPLDDLEPGAVIHFQVGVSVDPAVSIPWLPGTGNHGLACVVYDVVSDLAGSRGYVLTPLTPASSGWSELPGGTPGALHDVTKPMYVDSGTTSYAGYNGGWGFDNSSLPTGGDVTSSPGSIQGAGMLIPSYWDQDVNPSYPGQQPEARLGVGHGIYTFPDDDPCLAGSQGGFGQAHDRVGS